MLARMRRATLCIIIALVSAHVVSGEPPSVAVLREKIKAYRASITDIDYSFHSETTAPEPDAPDFVKSFVPYMSYRLMFSNGLARVEEMRPLPTGQNKTITSYDGKEIRSVALVAGKASAKVQRYPEEGVAIADFVGAGQLWPSPFAGVQPSQDLLQLLGEEEHVQIAEGEVFDQRCALITIRGANQIWLDLEHGAIVRRAIFSDGRGQTYFEFSVPRLLKQNGVWFPAETETTMYVSVGGSPELGESLLKTVHTVDEITINSGLKAEDLLVQFPLGVPVTRVEGFFTESMRKTMLEIAPLLLALPVLTLTLWIGLRWKSRKNRMPAA